MLQLKQRIREKYSDHPPTPSHDDWDDEIDLEHHDTYPVDYGRSQNEHHWDDDVKAVSDTMPQQTSIDTKPTSYSTNMQSIGTGVSPYTGEVLEFFENNPPPANSFAVADPQKKGNYHLNMLSGVHDYKKTNMNMKRKALEEKTFSAYSGKEPNNWNNHRFVRDREARDQKKKVWFSRNAEKPAQPISGDMKPFNKAGRYVDKKRFIPRQHQRKFHGIEHKRTSNPTGGAYSQSPITAQAHVSEHIHHNNQHLANGGQSRHTNSKYVTGKHTQYKEHVTTTNPIERPMFTSLKHEQDRIKTRATTQKNDANFTPIDHTRGTNTTRLPHHRPTSQAFPTASPFNIDTTQRQNKSGQLQSVESIPSEMTSFNESRLPTNSYQVMTQPREYHQFSSLQNTQHHLQDHVVNKNPNLLTSVVDELSELPSRSLNYTSLHAPMVTEQFVI